MLQIISKNVFFSFISGSSFFVEKIFELSFSVFSSINAIKLLNGTKICILLQLSMLMKSMFLIIIFELSQYKVLILAFSSGTKFRGAGKFLLELSNLFNNDWTPITFSELYCVRDLEKSVDSLFCASEGSFSQWPFNWV